MAGSSAGETTSGEVAQSGGRNPWLIFGIVALALFMGSIDLSIVSTALPAIHHSLGASINWVGWTITIYSLGSVISMPIAGRISDQLGRRRVFLVAVAIFTLASLACGLATNIYLLIALRAIQAIGGGGLQPSAAGIVAEHFGKNRDRAIGLFSTVAATGQVAGPIFGGIIVGLLSWRWIFYVNVPIGVVLLLLTARFIPESQKRERSPIDLRGLVMMSGAVMFANVGITVLGDAHTSIDNPLFLLSEVAAGLLGWRFYRHIRFSEHPFIPLRLIRSRGFAVVNVLTLLWGIVGFGVASLLPLYAEQRYHLPALSSGTLLTARGIGAIAVGAAATFALRRTGYRLPMVVGYLLTMVGLLLLSIGPRFGIGPYIWLSVGAGFTGLGNGMANPPSRNASLQLAPDEVGTIMGLRSSFIYVGIIFSVSIVTAILNRTTDPALMQAHIYWVMAGILALVMVPLVARVPEHRGSW